MAPFTTAAHNALTNSNHQASKINFAASSWCLQCKHAYLPFLGFTSSQPHHCDPGWRPWHATTCGPLASAVINNSTKLNVADGTLCMQRVVQLNMPPQACCNDPHAQCMHFFHVTPVAKFKRRCYGSMFVKCKSQKYGQHEQETSSGPFGRIPVHSAASLAAETHANNTSNGRQ